jgi:histidinol-phosphate/aromatic aminotransferase/cobyric acid decarboxylase-like protein
MEDKMSKAARKSTSLRIALATVRDRQTIYRLRHEVYARELGQHPENSTGKLFDSLDAFNLYITASVGGKIVGFISITPPNQASYSIDKYFSRANLPFPFDGDLYEVRLLTVIKAYRGRQVANLLMYAAFRWIEAHGGKRIVAIGRQEVLDIYLKVGLQLMGYQTQSGAVTYELLQGTTSRLRDRLARYASVLNKLEAGIDWGLDIPFHSPQACYHGGDFFEAIGDEFDYLDRSRYIINADVLDAWYPPSPKVVHALQDYLPWLLRTSPPTDCGGMIRTIARVRSVEPDCILPGAGSSDLIFLALRQWLTASSRTLILDPSYGEYAYLLEQVIGCRVERLPLARSNNYRLDLSLLEAQFAKDYDLIVLVNPNSPTGQHVPRPELEQVLRRAPKQTRVWVDETYVEYAGPDQSLEQFAARRENIIVCKSMSKVYALSGVRAAYLCAGPHLIAPLRRITPPWAVSLPAQVAAVKALQDPEYYAKCYEETHVLRNQLAEALLASSKMEIIPSVTNYLLCHLPPDGPDALAVVERCRDYGLFLRNAATMGSELGRHALRIAVKGAETNPQVVEMLARAMSE